jgi:hypothetical protein
VVLKARMQSSTLDLRRGCGLMVLGAIYCRELKVRRKRLISVSGR